MKLIRYAIVFIIGVIMLILLMATIPTIAWIFGASFREVAQSVPHVIISGFGGITAVVYVLEKSIDKDMYFKP